VQVAIRDLKANLSRILARAQAGESIEVTSRNRPVARIIGIPGEGDAGALKLVARGEASWSGSKPQWGPPIELASSGNTISSIVVEDRG
jgi:prevent-host-death family protein